MISWREQERGRESEMEGGEVGKERERKEEERCV